MDHLPHFPWMETEENLTLSALEQRVRSLATSLNAPAIYLPTFGYSQEDGTPHIEISCTYDFVVSERGNEFERRRTRDVDELLFWVFQAVTFSMASEYELSHRRRGEDSRRQLFAVKVDLLKTLSPEWGQREDENLKHILRQHPFRDR